MPKTETKTKRRNVARQIALALVAVLEDYESARSNEPLSESAAIAHGLLKTLGYGELESTQTRVARIEVDIAEALKSKDYDALPKLGQEMKRAQAGLPPLTTEKKARKPRTKKEPEGEKEAPAEPRAKRRKKEPTAEADPNLPDITCSNQDCEWTGKAEAGSACPGCGYLLKG